MTTRTTLCAAMAALLAAPLAQAAEDGFYLGAGLGEANTKIQDASLSLKDTQGAYKIIAGFRPLDFVAVEANYVDFGKAAQAGNSAKSRAVDAFVVGFLPIPLVDIYGKLGYANWKITPGISTADFKKSGSDLAYGGGVQMGFGGLSVRVEYEKFNASSAQDLSLVSAGLTWTFL